MEHAYEIKGFKVIIISRLLNSMRKYEIEK